VLVEPIVGLLADRGWRRPLMLGGGVLFAATAGLVAAASGFWTLLLAEVLSYPASGALVGLGQASLMDVAPSDREGNMARWTLAGSVGVVAAPILLIGILHAGGTWRWQFAALAAVTLAVVLAARRVPPAPRIDESILDGIRGTLALLRRREVLRWLLVLEFADLMLDVLHGFLALYLVDVARASPAQAALGVVVWTGAGLLGDGLLLIVLRHASGLRYLRISAAIVLVAYPAFLLAPSVPTRIGALALLGLLNAGWYAIPKAQLYDTLDERSGAILALGTLGSLLGGCAPLAIGLVAGSAGIGTALWIPAVAPLALLVGLPRRDPPLVDRG
jgi:FSR family fosmidomycin resistance protein-like MFS transporter